MAESTLMGCLPIRGATGDFKAYEDINVILQSIYVILNTPIGTRPWQPKFGCNLKLDLFELLDDTTLEAMKNDVQNALNRWEPRIAVTEVSVEKTSDESVGVSVRFLYNNTEYSNFFNTFTSAADANIYNLCG